MSARGVAALSTGIALLAGGLAEIGTAGEAPTTDTVAIADTITLRLKRPDRRGHLRSRLDVRRLQDGDAGRVSFVRGKPLLDDEARPIVVVPLAVAEARVRRKQPAEGLSDETVLDAERFLRHLERTGRARPLRHLFFYDYRGFRKSPVITDEGATASRSRRRATRKRR